MKITLQRLALWVAIAMSAYAGTLATTGLAQFLPGVTLPGGLNAVVVLGALLEIGELVTVAYLYRHWKTMVWLHKYPLVALVSAVAILDIVGLSGQLSHGHEARVDAVRAVNIAATRAVEAKIAGVKADIADLDQQIARSDAAATTAMEARVKARANRGRIKAATSMEKEVAAQRTRLSDEKRADLAKLVAFQNEAGQAEAAAVKAGGEFAAVQFLAETSHTTQEVVIERLILVLATLVKGFEIGLMIAAGHGPTQAQPQAEVEVLTPRQAAARRGVKTKKLKAAMRAKARKTGPQLVVPQAAKK